MRGVPLASPWPARGVALASPSPMRGVSLACSWPARGVALASPSPMRGVALACSWHMRGVPLACSWPTRGVAVACSWHMRGVAVASPSPARGVAVACSWPMRGVAVASPSPMRGVPLARGSSFKAGLFLAQESAYLELLTESFFVALLVFFTEFVPFAQLLTIFPLTFSKSCMENSPSSSSSMKPTSLRVASSRPFSPFHFPIHSIIEACAPSNCQRFLCWQYDHIRKRHSTASGPHIYTSL